MATPHILILGGTGEARRLAEKLVAHGDANVTLSLAGRTAAPLAQAGEVRIGGFGGADGLTEWLRAHAVDVLADATHPFAARISANAIAAAEAACIPLVVLRRTEWQRQPGDNWIDARTVAEAARLLGDEPRTVFLAIGRQELVPFGALPQHRYVVRSVDPVDAGNALPGATYILDRGPFTAIAERQLLHTHGIEIVVAKNSGGEATYGKIAAARELSVPVVMVGRPPVGAAESVLTVEKALAKIRHLAGLPEERGE
ncbi:cobalt-precorrin-6A reductase [Aquibium sp. LZ166]|uniref:Cobalt-precorrin-6A reductase n=1 Tax=Aquibium pacificus TaxID=3153579 RepID=A0ABV3SMC6_9HYPH